jgi:hypothetical protein
MVYRAGMTKTKVRIMETKVQRTSYVRRVKQLEKRCPVCQGLFWGATNSRYCSRACQNKADYERHAEERRKERLGVYHQKRAQAAKA